MLENPQQIIKIENEILSYYKDNLDLLPNAIYIPFLNRYENLNELLSSLSWFEKQIIVLVSNEYDITQIDASHNFQVDFINCKNFEVTNQILNLKTFQSTKYCHNTSNWDLPLKRNFALIHAIQNQYENILLIDDDIDGITERILNKGIAALRLNNIVGCLVDGFADTSVIGHIEQKYGEQYYPFLSGNFLFINPLNAESFFPLIYNEDWLFMIPSINQNKVASVDFIKQKIFNPFDNINRIKLQEFGEIIAEGLFELISQSRFKDRYSDLFWDDYITYRKTYVQELLMQADNNLVSFLNESLSIIEVIKSSHCIDFIKDWEEDISTFKKMLKNET